MHFALFLCNYFWEIFSYTVCMFWAKNHILFRIFTLVTWCASFGVQRTRPWLYASFEVYIIILNILSATLHIITENLRSNVEVKNGVTVAREKDRPLEGCGAACTAFGDIWQALPLPLKIILASVQDSLQDIFKDIFLSWCFLHHSIFISLTITIRITLIKFYANWLHTKLLSRH